jgi:hypothetical protein
MPLCQCIECAHNPHTQAPVHRSVDQLYLNLDRLVDMYEYKLQAYKHENLALKRIIADLQKPLKK